MSDLLTRIFDADHQNGDARPYVTRHPMPTTALKAGHRVIVPVWAQGDVLGHAEATIVEVFEPQMRPGIARTEPFVVVDYEPGWADSIEIPERTVVQGGAAHYPYSIMCAVCFGHRDTACEQCGPAIESPTRYGITATVTRKLPDGYTSTVELPYFELNANVQGILNETAARNVALAIIADIAGVSRANLLDLSDSGSDVQASATAVRL